MAHLCVKSFGDRFIPRRTGDHTNYFHMNLSNVIFGEIQMDTARYRNYGRNVMYRKLYCENLMKIMGPKSRQLYTFSTFSENVPNVSVTRNWPVKPRIFPCIKAPDHVLDFPNVQLDLRHNVLDWSSSGTIAGILHGEVCYFEPYPKTELANTAMLLPAKPCLKFNPDGRLLAIARPEDGGFAVVNLADRKVRRSAVGVDVTALAWVGTRTIAVGCKHGNIIFASTITEKTTRGRLVPHCHEGPVLAIRKSCNGTYLATSGLDCTLKVWVLKTMELKLSIDLFAPIKNFDWHPWREPLLASPSGEDNKILTVWDVTGNEKVVASWEVDCTIDVLTFNKISGEMVISVCNKMSSKSLIYVLASCGEMVDLISWHIGRVPYLIWNGDNTQLLTAGVDENVLIWNFFEKGKPPIKPQKQFTHQTLGFYSIR